MGEGDIERFRERVAAMREVGCVQWGDIVLGPKPVPEADKPEPDIRDPEREYFEDLLPGRDVTAFLRTNKAK